MADKGEMNTKTWHSGKMICVAFFFIAAIVTIVSIAIVQNKPLQQKYKYGIVLDAGSSHTAVYIYHWPAEKENNTGMVSQLQKCKVKGKGISSYAHDPAGAGRSLGVCLEEAKDSIPAVKHQETPVYLGATAGMRLLKQQDESSALEVLKSVEKTLQASPFDFQGARIITGQEEGAFGWITVNYLSKNFQRAVRTIGALDLGGASTQITFVSKETIESPDNSMAFRLYGNDYQVYTHSFLCYGKDQVLKLALEKKIQSANTSLEDPCFHPGYNKEKPLTKVFDSPCVKTEISKEDESKTFMHSGSGRFQECQNSIKNVFDFSRCKNSQCSFNGVYQPHVEGMFGAFSAYYFVMNFLNLTGKSFEETKKGVEQYCATPWSTITEEHPKIDERYLAEYCFSGTYILTLLEDGYNFTSETWKDIHFIDTIEGSSAGWSLGYMLNLTNMIPAEAPDTPLMPHGGFVTLMLFLSLFLLVLLILGYTFLGRPSCLSPKEIV